MMNPKEIAKKYVGIAYKHHGRDPNIGLDCWGLILSIYNDIGIDLKDLEQYDEDWSDKGANHFIENYDSLWEKVEAPALYDILLFRTDPNKNPNHAGVFLSDGKFIQSVKLGVIVSKVNIPRFKGIFEGFYRYRGLKK